MNCLNLFKIIFISLTLPIFLYLTSMPVFSTEMERKDIEVKVVDDDDGPEAFVEEEVPEEIEYRKRQKKLAREKKEREKKKREDALRKKITNAKKEKVLQSVDKKLVKTQKISTHKSEQTKVVNSFNSQKKSTEKGTKPKKKGFWGKIVKKCVEIKDSTVSIARSFFNKFK